MWAALWPGRALLVSSKQVERRRYVTGQWAGGKGALARYLSRKALRFMSMSYWLRQRLKRWRMLVLLAIIRPLTRCAEGAYGDFLESATYSRHMPRQAKQLQCLT